MNVATSDSDIASEGRKTHRRRVNAIGGGFFKALEGFLRPRKGSDNQKKRNFIPWKESKGTLKGAYVF